MSSATRIAVSEVEARCADVLADLATIIPLRSLPAVLWWAARTMPDLADREEAAGQAVAWSVENDAVARVESELDEWLDLVEMLVGLYRNHVGDPARTPIPIWHWWVRYTPTGESKTALSCALDRSWDVTVDVAQEVDRGA